MACYEIKKSVVFVSFGDQSECDIPAQVCGSYSSLCEVNQLRCELNKARNDCQLSMSIVCQMQRDMCNKVNIFTAHFVLFRQHRHSIAVFFCMVSMMKTKGRRLCSRLANVHQDGDSFFF